jgi:hypothetical protein
MRELAIRSVSNDQHPDHQVLSNRGTTNGAIERLQLRAHALQVEKLVDPLKQVVIITFASMNVCLLGDCVVKLGRA